MDLRKEASAKAAAAADLTVAVAAAVVDLIVVEAAAVVAAEAAAVTTVVATNPLHQKNCKVRHCRAFLFLAHFSLGILKSLKRFQGSGGFKGSKRLKKFESL